jgi:hypothetical protein
MTENSGVSLIHNLSRILAIDSSSTVPDVLNEPDDELVDDVDDVSDGVGADDVNDEKMAERRLLLSRDILLRGVRFKSLAVELGPENLLAESICWNVSELTDKRGERVCIPGTNEMVGW